LSLKAKPWMAMFVMPGLVPGIHVFAAAEQETWMAGTTPGHDEKNESFSSGLLDHLEHQLHRHQHGIVAARQPADIEVAEIVDQGYFQRRLQRAVFA
jgi:hypothetical protein